MDRTTITITNSRGERFTGASRDEARAKLIAAARADLLRRAADDPIGVNRLAARLSNLDRVRKRERERVEYLVLDHARPKLKRRIKGAKGRRKTIEVRQPIDPSLERAVRLREEHIGQGTPETTIAAANHEDTFEQLERNGTVDKQQREWADEIANVYRSIESDVAVSIASLEARVDNSSDRRNLVAESIKRVRLHHAYTLWREALPAGCRSIVFDMIVGDRIGYTVAARRYRTHKRRAKRVLIDALNLWPVCVGRSFDIIDADVYRALVSGQPAALPDNWRQPTAERAQPVPEFERDIAAEPLVRVLAAVDPVFLDEHGRFRPWEEIAAIVRDRAA